MFCLIFIFGNRLLFFDTKEKMLRIINYIYIPTEFDFLYNYYSSDNVSEIRQYLREYLMDYSETGDVVLLDYSVEENLIQMDFSFAKKNFIAYIVKTDKRIAIDITEKDEMVIIKKFMFCVRNGIYDKAYSMLHSDYPMSYESFVSWFDIGKQMSYSIANVTIKRDIPYITIYYGYEKDSYFVLNCYLIQEDMKYKIYPDNLLSEISEKIK